MKILFRLTSLMLVLLVAPLAVRAATGEPELLTSVTPQQGSIDDTYTFSVTVNNVMTGIAPMLSGGVDFNLRLLGPQSSVRIVNGDISSSVAYIYRLTPKKEGDLMTPSAEIEVEGRKYAAPALKVAVRSQGDPQDSPPAPDTDKAFLRQIGTPTSVYQGQQIVTTTTLYTRVHLREITLDDVSYDDFWQESFGPDQRTTKQINGQRYTAVQLKRSLYALKSGKLVLPARKMSALARGEGGGGWPFPGMEDFPDEGFGGLFGAPSKQINLSSNAVEIEVKPLPPPPTSLANDRVIVVGPTSLKLSYSSDSIKVGAGKTVEIEVISEGNLNPLRGLDIDAGKNLRIYDEKPESQRDSRGAVLVNHKTFRYSLVPLKPGTVRVPPVTLTYFDPVRGEYASATTPPITFDAEADPSAPVQSQANDLADEPTLSAHSTYTPIPTLPPVDLSSSKTITPYEEQTTLQRVASRVPLSVALLLCATVGLLAILAWAFSSWRARVKPKKHDLSAVKHAASIRELNDATRSFLSGRFAIGSSNMTSDELRQALAQKGFPPEFTFEVGSLLDEFDLLLYSGSSSIEETELTRLRERVEELVRRTL